MNPVKIGRLTVAVLGTAGLLVAAGGRASAAEVLTAKLHPVSLEGSGVDESKDLGTVTFNQKGDKVIIHVQAKGMPPGKHGLHIHRDGSCGIGKVNDKDAPAGAAGPHFDPANTGKHLGPQGEGHAGDLANLEIKPDGTGALKEATKKVKLADLKGRAVVVHASEDNYTDTPPLGGSGARIACGVIGEK
ncbi:MAG TPA: superoxide dismutase family protein [Candidatus Bathyarchaeia archaeon]|nr:superoxide dismutase family protein [Candidatus Bathyarchaeia archaeon]